MSSALNFGPRSLSRLACPKCGPETLHVRGKCNHCKRQNYTLSTPTETQPKWAVMKRITWKMKLARDAKRSFECLTSDLK
jgi:predicted dithiol-disulfide oxidoreductase (DUF899 family)